MTHRAPIVLLVTTAVALAGCTQVAPPLAEEDGTETVQAGSWASWQMPGNQAMTLTYSATVNDGPLIDIYVMNEANYQQYQDGGEFAVAPCSTQRTAQASASCELPQDAWYLVFDNTDVGQASPATVSTENQDAVVSYSFTAEA